MPKWWDWQAASAIATFSAALVALVVAVFGERLRTWIFRARLRLTLRDELGEASVEALVSERDEAGNPTQHRMENARYFHLKVANDCWLRWPAATQVQLLLLRVYEQGPSGSFVQTWSGELPISCRHQQVHPATHTIGPTKDFDLCSVVRGKWVRIHPLLSLHSLPGIWRNSAHLQLVFQARSVEVDSHLLTVQIDWDGQWADGANEMRRHLTVKTVDIDL